jgi:hypothetical protein
MRGRRPHKLGPRIGADAPQMTVIGGAEPSGSFRMLGPVSLQQVLEVGAEFDAYGGASLGLVAWELCVDEELVAPAWQQAITHGLLRPAARDWQEQLWRFSSAGWATVRRKRRSS